MEEQRKFERFALRLPTRIEKENQEQEKTIFDLLSRDVSAGGAFFLTNKPFPKDTRVKLTLTLLSETVKALTGTYGSLNLGGTVVRTDPNGMAICFDENYELIRFVPLDQ